MPLNLLGKKSWNVYNPANIARVKADEAAAAAREAAEEQRMQELDAERRAAILRGQTPPPLPTEQPAHQERQGKSKDCYARKSRRLAGEDDTDRDIRMAQAVSGPRNENDAAVMKLRQPKNNAPLTDHAGHIDLFPVDMKEAIKRERNAEAEKEKKAKERSYQDQFSMRLTNAAGKGGASEIPWYTARSAAIASASNKTRDTSKDDSGFSAEDVWGREDPGRKDRERARIASNDPLVVMKEGLAALKKHKANKKKLAAEKMREMQDLKAVEMKNDERDSHGERSKREHGHHDKNHRKDHHGKDYRDRSHHGKDHRDRDHRDKDHHSKDRRNKDHHGKGYHGRDYRDKDRRYVSDHRSSRDKDRYRGRSRSRSPIRNRSRDGEEDRRSFRDERRYKTDKGGERESSHRRERTYRDERAHQRGEHGERECESAHRRERSYREE